MVTVAICWATRQLLDRHAADPATVDWGWESMAVHVVLRYGSGADAEALLPVFLDAPAQRDHLVPVFARHGDLTMAERLLEAGIEAGRIREGVPPEVLHAVGYLGCESAERILWEHVDGPHHASRSACLGLLHLSCRGLRTEIAEALEHHAGANLFPEFLPVLATMTGDPSWRARLVEWGEGGASTDCNGGLFQGLALHGAAARADFVRALWSSRWEANGGGTGSDRWAYAGTRVLGLGMPELYADLLARLDSDASGATGKRHGIDTFAALLGHWTYRDWLGLRMAPDPEESSEALYRLLFAWSTPSVNDSLTGRAHRVLEPGDPLIAGLHHLETLLLREARHELELRTITSN
ncbi:hypothetical protein ABT301_01260 [Streptomyces sp. NPDC000987]|uniref:hypothetical protein n=1 Tax=Streptomyces sp. NPDC000987 TaxID=3154374 RepID=UPI00331C171C